MIIYANISVLDVSWDDEDPVVGDWDKAEENGEIGV